VKNSKDIEVGESCVRCCIKVWKAIVCVLKTSYSEAPNKQVGETNIVDKKV